MSDLVDTEQLAELLHCSEWAAGRLMGDSVPAAKIAGRWLARRSDVDAYIASRVVTGRKPGKRGARKRAPRT